MRGKTLLLRGLCAGLAFVTLALLAYALDVPFLAGRVNDTAGMLSAKTVQQLERELAAFEKETSNQVAVLTIPSLEGEAIEEYAIKVVETWKLGRKDKDNGVLLLISRDDRKMRIEVGDGLEGDLTDALSSIIIRREITPRFRDGDFDGGVRAGVEAIMNVIRGSYTAAESDEGSGNELDDVPLMARLFMGLIFIVVVGMFTFMGVFSDGCVSWFLYLFLLIFWAAFPPVILGATLGFAATVLFIFGYPGFKFWLAKTEKGKALKKKLESKSTKGGGHRGGGMFFGGMGGFTSGGFSGGGFSGGGFSGGGGSFSGGGASGGW